MISYSVVGERMARGGYRFGAGRPGWHFNADFCLRLDVREMARRKLLAGGSFTWRWSETDSGKEIGQIGININYGDVRLNFTLNGTPMRQTIRLERTACNYGGTRPWFHCPRCQRRVAVLFLRSGFVCRPCGRIAFGSKSEDALGRTWRRQQKLERRLGGGWGRPKGMHRTTRARILDSIFACERQRDDAIAAYAARRGLLDWL